MVGCLHSGAAVWGCSRAGLIPFCPCRWIPSKAGHKQESPRRRSSSRYISPFPAPALGMHPWNRRVAGTELSGCDVSSVVPQRFGKLKEAQDALEQAYLGARQHPGALGDFDPDR